MQGVGLVAVTYVYFLIFAQFAFIHRLDALGITALHLKSVMATMAFGGIVLSLVAPRVQQVPSPARRLQCAFGVAAVAAFVSVAPLNLASAIAVATLIGAALGLLTVTLVTHLLKWIGDRNALLKVGLGTGTGYFLCNVPLLFTASPQVQASAAGVFGLLGVVLANFEVDIAAESPVGKCSAPAAIPFPLVVASFAALVWLDSAAFFIIQSTNVLKAGTWQGSAHLWANAVIHLSAALLSAWLLLRRELPVVLAVAVGLLGFACVLLLDPARAITASVLYPAGVSFYSVALVAYPSLLSHASSSAERGRQAGWIYAIAGWIGSALGIGMGQNLGRVPPAFVAVAATVVFAPVIFKILRGRPREVALTAVVLFIALVVYRFMPASPVAASTSAIEHGRQVYISEGCIHCHSQYVRPGTGDVLMWGPVESLDKIHEQRPPLIGNRRQGPDLSQVGVRRSALWLKMHLYNPREVSGASIMPSFAFLFRDGRGNDLVAYLASLHSSNTQQHSADEREWHLSGEALASADTAEGPELYSRYCATCHSADGKTRLKWQAEFIESPAVMNGGVTASVSASEAQPAQDHFAQAGHFAQIIKFGVPKSDMAGHEYMPDKDVASLSLWLAQSVTQPSPEQTSHSTSGDEH